MKITIFNSSPKQQKSNTQAMVDEFVKGAEKAGAEAETIFLAQKQIKPCTGCLSCWFKTPGKCVFDDDMGELLEKVKKSNIVVFATPLYVDNISGLMKNFMDRFMPLLNPHIETDSSGESVHVLSQQLGDIAVISNCGYPEQSHFEVLRILFRRIARNMRCRLAAEIYRGGGSMMTEAPLLLKPIIWKYNKLLQQAGREVAEKGQLSDELKEQLEKPLVPADKYIAAANKYFDHALEKIKQ
ncbi:MAG: flavodoxin family protein [Phycisphaerae bacterium]